MLKTHAIVLLTSALLVCGQPAGWPLRNCSALDGAVLNASDVNLLFLSSQSNQERTTSATCEPPSSWSGGKCWSSDEYLALPIFAFFAARDFNARDGRYVPAFANLSGCDKQIKLTLADSRTLGAQVLKSVLDEVAGHRVGSLHGIVGPARSSQSVHIAPVTGTLDIIQLSYHATSPMLDNKQDFPRFGRTITADSAVAAAIVELWVERSLSYAAVFYVSDAYGIRYNEAVVEAALTHNLRFNSSLTVKSYPFNNADSLRQMLESFKTWEPTNRTGCSRDRGEFGCFVNNILFVGFDQQARIFFVSATELGVLVKDVPALVLLTDSATSDDLNLLPAELPMARSVDAIHTRA